ncbi:MULTISPECIES: lytic transglycosylase domain-containing protein [unclassified Bartonella]|uniref:lytic transglycosylase domain-containing protein n=1 Tax=unclassified Bartonella TaxID=2645622 RepID=UPI00300DF15E
MTILDFMALAAACAPAVHPTTLSVVVKNESQGHVYAIGINGNHKLSHQPSTFEEAVTTAEKLKQDGHNFDIGLGQINVKNLEWLDMSLSDLFDPCKNLKAVQMVLTHCYERAVSKYDSEQTALQAALSCYNTRDFEHDFTSAYVKKGTLSAEMKIPAFTPENNESLEFVQLHAEPQKQTVRVISSAFSQEEVADAFTHKTSSAHDAFAAENSSLLEKRKE